MTFLGWLGSILLAFCALPQALKTFKTKKADDISWGFLLMWLFGEIFTLIFILPKAGVLPLVVNYACNIVLILVILKYKLRGKNE